MVLAEHVVLVVQVVLANLCTVLVADVQYTTPTRSVDTPQSFYHLQIKHDTEIKLNINQLISPSFRRPQKLMVANPGEPTNTVSNIGG